MGGGSNLTVFWVAQARTLGCGEGGDLRRHTRAFEARRTRQAFCPDAQTTGRLAPPLAFWQRARSRLSAPSLVCREAGATVARDVRIADMNIDVPVVDDRRIEVVANGLPRWHGAQLVVDATLVSPVTCTGKPQTRADFSAVSLASDSKGRTPNILCVLVDVLAKYAESQL